MAGIPRGPLLLVSPHLDDAVLSCWAVLERAEPLAVLTIFAGSPNPPQRGWWDRACGFASSAESMPARLREDEAAFSDLPHNRRYLSLLELQYLAGDRKESDAEAIVTEVSSWIAANPAGTVALPAGAGCKSGRITRRLRRLLGRPCEPPPHPDHLFVRDAALPVLAGQPATSLLLYEELPYLFAGPSDGEAQLVADRGWHVEPLLIPVDRAAKAARIAAYASQVGPLSPPDGRLDEPGTLPRGERYWLLRRASTSE